MTQREHTLHIDEEFLDLMQRKAFDYFLHECDPDTGLVADSTEEGKPASISATGMALAAYPVGVWRGYISRQEAAKRVLKSLRFFKEAPQGTQRYTTGYRGFIYHFLDMGTGRRVGRNELSTIDTAILIMGALTARQFFDSSDTQEREIRQLAEDLYTRVNWQWATNGSKLVQYGWHPQDGFLEGEWDGYDEAMLLYALALGSPTHPLPPESYRQWTAGFKRRTIYGHEYIYAGPLFIHQLPHLWLDLKGMQDDYLRAWGEGHDYFQNSSRATYVQQQYAIRNPRNFRRYGRYCWGITASHGPGPDQMEIDGVERVFYDYMARGVPDGPDDGTLAPWAVAASLPFTPEIVIPTLKYFVEELHLKPSDEYGFKATFNPTYPDGEEHGWVCPWNFGINQGPIILMVENYRTGFIWQLMRRCDVIVEGLRKANFRGGWLSESHST